MPANTQATERIKKLYSKQAGIYDVSRAGLLFGRKRLVKAVQAQPGERALDIGCGTGALLERLADSVGPDGEVVGIDCSAAMLGQAARRTQRFGSRVRLIESSFEPTTFLNQSFDVVTFGYSLTLMGDAWRRAVADAVSLLRPGSGRIGVVDFTHARQPAKALFESHAVRFTPGLREVLAAAAEPRFDQQRRAWGGLWHYAVWVGLNRPRRP